MVRKILEAISTEDFFEWLSYHNIRLHVTPMSGRIRGMVYLSRSGRYHIWINDYMSPEAKRRTVVHELAHILKDSPRVPYLVGIDMRRETIEVIAEAVAGTVYR